MRAFRLILLLLAFAPASPAFAQQTTWQASLWGQPRAFTYHLEQLSKLVRVKTGGSFVIELNYGGLSKPRQNLEGISEGKFELAQFCAGYHPEKNRLITVLELPFLGVETLSQEAEVSRSIYAHPAVVTEMAKWNATILMPTPLPQYNLVGRGPTPQSAAWFQGKRIRATGGIGRLFERLGAVAVSLTAIETRKAFESGDIDAVAFAPHAHFSFDTISLAEWWTSNLNPGTVNCPVVVNSDALASLSPEHRKALEDAAELSIQQYLVNYADLLGKWSVVLEVLEKDVVGIPADVAQTMRTDAQSQIIESWIDDMDQSGLPSRDLISLVRDTLGVQ